MATVFTEYETDKFIIKKSNSYTTNVYIQPIFIDNGLFSKRKIAPNKVIGTFRGTLTLYTEYTILVTYHSNVV